MANKKKEIKPEKDNKIETEKKQPRVVTEPFLEKQYSTWNKVKMWFGKEPVNQDGDEMVKELEEPLLFLMKENGFTDIIEGAQAGEMIIATPKGEKSIMLTPDKLTTLRYGDDYYKAWIAYENSATPYPEDPLHTAEMYKKTIQKLALNWRDLDDNGIDAKTKFWLIIIGVLFIGGIMFLSTDAGKNLLAQWTGHAVNATITNSTTLMQNETISKIIG